MEPVRFDRLEAAFVAALAETLRGATSVTVLYSGGVDSSLIAQAAGAEVPIRLRSVGAAGAPDVREAETGAALLGLPWTSTVVGPDDVRRALARHRLADRREPSRSVQVSLAVALEASGAGRILVGQGADELFGGYAHFRGLTSEEAEDRRTTDWNRLRDDDWPLTVALASELGCDVRAPFLDPSFAREAMSLPLPPVQGTELTKPTLRAWAVHRGVPAEITRRPKRAMQFGTGIARMVRSAVAD